MELKTEADSDVPQGYKRTEVGVIPEDWRVVKLGAHALFKTGPFGSALHKSDYVRSGIPVVNPMQIIDGRILPSEHMTISQNAAQKLSDFLLVTDDLVMGRRGDMGRCARIGIAESGWLCGTGSIIIRPLSTLNSFFAQRILSSPFVKVAIERTSVGTTMVNLNQSTLANLQIPLPPTKAEQEAIAEALSDADALIQSLEQLIAKKRLIKQGTLQELLTPPGEDVVEKAWEMTPECSPSSPSAARRPTRLPGFSGKWHKRTLGELANRIVGGGTPSRSINRYWIGDIPWMTVKDFVTFSPLGTTEYISKEGLSNSASNLIKCGTLITSTRMALGKAVVFEVDVAINQDLKALYLNDFVSVPWLYYWFQHRERFIASLGSGSTVDGISVRDLSKIELFIPPTKAEQTAIAAVLSEMDNEIKALESKLSKARLLKQGMMQELLTGGIRLVKG